MTAEEKLAEYMMQIVDGDATRFDIMLGVIDIKELRPELFDAAIMIVKRRLGIHLREVPRIVERRPK